MDGLINFTFTRLYEETDKKGKINKKMIGMPNWNSITDCNHSKYIKSNHTGHAVITGKMSNITVFDFDDEEVYHQIVKEFPELTKYKTIKTKNGFHVYCLYEEEIMTTTNAFSNYPKVDVRNDSSIVFAPPCQRKLLDGTTFIYSDLGGEILPVPKIFKDNLKQYQMSPQNLTLTTPLIETALPATPTPLIQKQIEIDYKYIKEAIEKGYLDTLAFESYDEWRNVGFAIKHSLGDKGLELFHEFSKKNGKYDQQYTDQFWNTIKQTGKPLTIASIKYWVKKYKKIEKETESENTKIVKCDDDACNLFFDELKDVLVYNKGQLFYKEDNVWIYENDKIESYLINYILKSGVKKTVEMNGVAVQSYYCGNISNAKNVYKALIHRLKSSPQIDIYDKFHTTTKNRICFSDGVLDFKAKKFYTWDKVDFEYYTTQMIQRKFADYFVNPDREIMKKINDEVFSTLFGEDIEKAYLFLSRGITSNIQDKNWATYLGNRNCGKGVLYDLLKKSFDEYVSTFELNNILCQRNTNTIDEASKKLYWSLDLQFTRIAISQETPKSDSGLKLSGKMMKKLASGGDTLVARRNYDRVDTHFNIDTTFLIMGNDYLDVDTKDTNEHRIEFNSVVSFKSKEEIEKMIADGLDERVISTYKIKNDEIKNMCKTEEYSNALVMLLFEKWVNNAVVNTKELEDQEESLRQRILDKYIITKNIKDFVLINDIAEEMFDTGKKIDNELKSLGIQKKKLKAKEHRDKWAFIGITKKVVDEI